MRSDTSAARHAARLFHHPPSTAFSLLSSPKLIYLCATTALQCRHSAFAANMTDEIPLVMSNPNVQPPRKTPSNRLSLHSRSISRSSSRQYGQARDFDPILRNLSPTTTLRAFSEPGLLEPNDNLNTSLQHATYSERTLGAKAAQTGLDVRSWARELEEWEWPGTFDEPESVKKIRENTNLIKEDGSATKYWGSLPAVTVKEYEQRADEIVQQLDDIDVEELKNFVLSAHHEAGNGSASIEDSIGAIGAATDLRKLDDFTAIITATILQALPYLSRLNRLLDTWTIRLAILRQAPTFLDALLQARKDLDRAWTAIGVTSSSEAEKEKSVDFNRGNMIETQSVIEHKVGSLGRKLDRFLDDLEGRSETVPDSWIENMETLEQQYAEWTVQAERKVLENELKKNRWSKIASPKTAQAAMGGQPSAIEKEKKIAPDEIGAGRGLLDPPILSPSSSIYSGQTAPADTALPIKQTISPSISSDRATTSMLDLARDDSQTIPSDQADPIVDRASVHSGASSRRSRHVPITLPYDGGDGQEYPPEGITGDLVSRGGGPAPEKQAEPASAAPSDEKATSFAKRRALFTGDLERTQSLQRATKSPVRPFEHASNAFARLFNKMETSTPERSRSSSRSEVERLRSASNKTENGIIWGGRPMASPKRSPRRKTMDSSPHGTPKSQDRAVSVAPVAADSDAPPVPTLPPKSPRRSLQSPMRPRVEQPASRTTSPKEAKTQPFPDFDFGENWPLTPPEPASEHDTPVEAQIARFQAQTQDEHEGPSLISPKKPLECDFFHRVFVDGLPGTPEHDRTSSPALPERNDLAPPFVYAESPQEQSPFPPNSVPTVDPSMLNSSPELVQHAHFGSRETPFSTSPKVQKPSHIDLPTNGSSLPVPLKSADGPVTPNSVASDTYSPEIQDARVSYFQMTSPSLSRTTSAATTSPNHLRTLSSQTTSPMKLRSPPNGQHVSNEHEVYDDSLARRASGISLEVRTIDLTRRKSSSSAIEPDVHAQSEEPSSPVSRKDMSIFPTPPTIHEERPRSPVSPLAHPPGQHELRHRTSNLSVVSDQTSPVPEQAGLNAFMCKRRGLGLQPGNTPTNTRTKKRPEADSFDRHVSEVIQKLPSAIRFRSGATTPQPGDTRTFSGPRPKLNPRVSSRMADSITLAPADPSPNRRSPAANEPEVKLYHLTQAGREEPIKLFVRLVGEGERVMVRVGGGWADLADYLRQYAEHHGSRTVSGEVDVKAFSSPIAAGGNGGIHPALRRKASGPLSNELYRTKSNTPSPDTPVQGIAEHPEKENSDPSALLSTSTPTRPPVPPRSPSRPSTSDSNRPGSKHSWTGSSISGTGGSGKKFDDLSEDKKRWVEGMIDRVQTASADKKGDGQQKQKFFGELGTVGGTRRVVFNNRSASSVETGKN